MYFNSCCSCSFEPEIIKIGLSSHKMYRNNIVNFQESTTIVNAWTKKSGNLLKAPCIYIYTDIYIYNNIHKYIFIESTLYINLPRLFNSKAIFVEKL